MTSFHKLIGRKDKSGTINGKKVMSIPSPPVPSSPSASTCSTFVSPATPTSLDIASVHVRSSSLSSLSNAFSAIHTKGSPRLQATVGAIESSTANSCDGWLLQPKQTSGFPKDSLSEDDDRVFEGNTNKKVEFSTLRISCPLLTKQVDAVSQLSKLLVHAGITAYNDSDISYALHSHYANGNPQKAFELMKLLKEAEAGLIRPYDPHVEMLGAVNREGTTCYLDSLLFAMFTRTKVFEAMLYSPTFNSEEKQRLATLLRLWVSQLRTGKLITTDLTMLIQQAIAECGWKEAAEIHQQDASEAFHFLAETLNLPLITLKMDIYHAGKVEDGNDHRFVNERLLEVAVPEDYSDGSTITLEDCLTTYFNNRIEVKRHLQRTQPTGSLMSKPSFDSEKGRGTHIETVEYDESCPSTPLSPLPTQFKSPRPKGLRARAPSIIQEYISEKSSGLDALDYESPQGPRRRTGSIRKEVLMPAWQFFKLIPWYTNTSEPTNNAQLAAHFSEERPVLGICLKRYSFEPNGEAVRRNTHIDIPLEFALPHFIEDDSMAEDAPPIGNFKISLQSAICHRGTTVHSGHYIGLVRTPNPSNPYEDRWMRHDDLAPDRVAEVEINQFLRDETPYLLFYQVIPLDGDPGNIADAEVPVDSDLPPAYSRWDIDPDFDFEEKFGLRSSLETETDSTTRVSDDLDSKRSNLYTAASSNGTYAESNSQRSIEGDDSWRSSKNNPLAVQSSTVTHTEGNRLSTSMSRFANRLSREKPDKSLPAPPLSHKGPSLEVQGEPGATDRSKLKKEKSKSRLKDHQSLSKGKDASEKPDRECVLM
ncbi:MAG: hypothetical protein LQ352_004720 [Teloschistes flavicans]|nr:MAG: hypothetical protein LQ352_004720 [Teloschistes flavicans]